ncbi:MAG: glutamate racemase, partial [Chlamydiota bacterium]
HAALPYENICYFGDTARVPYGNKSPETIKKYARENARFLQDQNIKILVVACNTACALATDLHSYVDVPLIGVIEPGVRHAVESTRSGSIAVLGTKGTISSGAYQERLKAALPEAKIFAAACPLLVHVVEEQLFTHAATRLLIEEYTAPLMKNSPDTVILGCTHYPLLQPLFQEILGEDIILIDPAYSTALAVQQKLRALDQLNSGPEKGSCAFFVSDDVLKFKETGELFFQRSLDKVTLKI